MKSIVLGSGCFWCIEAVFQRVRGVETVVSGYAGGELKDPTYENHGLHAEVVQITYDPEVVPLEKLYEIFFSIHDPTTFNQQGYDIGPQYRSIILCNDYLESELAHRVIDGIKELWDNPVVTEVTLLDKFYKAEDYQQNFYNKNTEAGYCQVIINPKLEKLNKKYSTFLK